MKANHNPIFQCFESPLREKFIEFFESNRYVWKYDLSNVWEIYSTQNSKFSADVNREDIYSSVLYLLILSARRADPSLTDEEIDEEFNKIPDKTFQKLAHLHPYELECSAFSRQDIEIISKPRIPDALQIACAYVISVSSVKHTALLIDEIIGTSFEHGVMYSINEFVTAAELFGEQLQEYPLSWVLEIASEPNKPTEILTTEQELKLR